MNNQEIFDNLSELEEALYYKMVNPGDLIQYNGILAEIHESIKDSLRKWHNITGLTN